MCSWVSFWIVRADSAARCALGITTVLSVTNIGFTGKGIKPQVPYATALDMYVQIELKGFEADLTELICGQTVKHG